mgnify:FL=1
MILNHYKYIFFDFDGVIKESLTVKAEAFKELFREHGESFCQNIWEHHMQNGGLSRINKIKLYMDWTGKDFNNTKLEELVNEFGDLVKDKVIKSPWVPGVLEFLKEKKDDQIFFIVSAAPEQELQEICSMLRISKFFTKIYGSPVSKTKAISDSINHHNLSLNECLMIGDYNNDRIAASNNRISFVLRSHEFNTNVKVPSDIRVIENFLRWEISN